MRILNFRGSAELLGLCHLNPDCVGWEQKHLFCHQPHSCSSHSGVFSLSENYPSQPINYLLGGHQLHSHSEKLLLEKELGSGWAQQKKKENERVLQLILLVRRLKSWAKWLECNAKAFVQAFISHRNKIFYEFVLWVCTGINRIILKYHCLKSACNYFTYFSEFRLEGFSEFSICYQNLKIFFPNVPFPFKFCRSKKD